MKREAYHHGNLKRALVEEGIALLREEGLAALSLRAIAKRVGVSHTAPRNHFGSLRGLLTAIAAEGFRRHAAAMREGLPEGAAPGERMRAALEGYARFAETNPELYALMFDGDRVDMADPVLSEAGDASYAVLSGLAGREDLSVPATREERRREGALWTFAHGYVALRRMGGLTKDGRTPGPSELFETLRGMGG